MSAATSPGTGLAYGLRRVCAAWGMARSSFYAMTSGQHAEQPPAKRRGPKPAISDQALLVAIEADLEASPWEGEGYRKVWARLRVCRDIRVARKRVLRLMRENNLLSPHRCRRRGGNPHDSEIITHAPNLMWGTDGVRVFTVPVAIGGVHVSNDVNRVLDDVATASFAFVREADLALPRFIEVVRQKVSISELGQVIFNDENRRLSYTADCQPGADDLNTIPAYDLTEMPANADHGVIGAFYCFKPSGTKFATVLSNRGCRAQCTFCSVRNFNGVGVRQRRVESVVDELEILEKEYGVDHVMWLDDDLLKDHARAIELFNEKVRRGLKLTWDATNGVIASSCTEDVIAAAAESGCIAINIGMESGNRKILREVKKPGTVETFIAAAEVLRRYEEIHASVFLMLGFPGETLAMIEDSIDVARQMDLDWYRVSPLTPLPNTPIYDSMVAQGLTQSVGSSDVRFMGGAYGKQPEIERGGRLARPRASATHSQPFPGTRFRRRIKSRTSGSL